MSTNAGDANAITRAYFDSILIEERLIDATLPDISMELFGKTYATPIMMPAFSHLPSYGEGRENGLIEYARAAKAMPFCNWVGMMENDQFESICKVNPDTVRIVKPYADHDKILDQLAFSEKVGALAVGLDPDHIFGEGAYDIVNGELMARQTTADLKEYVNLTKLPFIVKGVLSVRDAVKCAECGVKGIVVSHHHGRLPFAIPPLMVLPEIKKALEGSGVKIFVDCGVDTGADAFKALALGADAVSVGRAFLPALTKDGEAGVTNYVKDMNKELINIMGFTGCDNIAMAEPSMLWKDGKPMA